MQQDSISTIAIVYNLKPQGVISDAYEEYDEFATIDALKNQIEQFGYQVNLLEYDSSFLKRIVEHRPDFVLNIAEGVGIGRNRESQIPVILESLGIPYSGSDGLSLAAVLDKHFAYKLLKAARIPVPEQFLISKETEVKLLRNIFKSAPRWIIKPRWEGSSKGIFLTSVVKNYDTLYAGVRRVINEYKQAAVVEEFLEKDEITVGVIGNQFPRILGMMKIVPVDMTVNNFIYSIEIKRDWEKKVKYLPQSSIASVTQAWIESLALKIFSSLELRDIARVDFRMDSKNIPKVIDINPIPGLSPRYSDLPILWSLAGNKYSQLIRLFLSESFSRYGIKFNPKKLSMKY
ncbi:MAG: ATP-grasp domain-containing protein [Candidatus Omnitrophota bacterium]|nr:ATP-grasp domain-containing protein [Candidatus Omnitrophota bacterium]